MRTLFQDLHFAARLLLRKPSFTVLAVIVLALGIGANSAIFSVINGVLLRPLDYRQPERLVVLAERLQRVDQLELSADDFVDYQNRVQTFEQFAASERVGLNHTGGSEPLRIEGAAVTAEMFPMLGVAPLLGRTFTPEEDRAGASPVVILSYSLWQRRFGGDPNIIGQLIPLNGQARTVIGVMPQSFQYPPPLTQSGAAYEVRSELWVPRILENETRRNSHNLFAIGRLKEGVTFEQARTEIEALATARQQTYRESHESIGVNVQPLHERVVGNVRPALLILLGAVGFVLLIACANVANLLLVRALARHKEMAIRAALGAGRLRLLRQLLTESLLLALLGGGVGLLLAYWSNQFLLSFSAANIPRLQQVSLDERVLAFTLLVSLLTGVIFGLLPAFKASRLDLNDALKSSNRAASSSVGRLHNALVVSEVALALVMLIGTGLLIKSFWQLQQINPGFDPHNLLVMETTLPATKYATAQQQTAFFRQALERIAAVSGVETAALVNNPPLSSRRGVDAFAIEGRPEPQTLADTPLADFRGISGDYFRVMGVPIVAGRAFAEADDENAPLVAIINEAVARRYFPDEDPLGKRVRTKDAWHTIVGIVGDVHQSGLESEASTHLYLPYWQIPQGRMGIVVRTTADPTTLVGAIRNQITALDSEQPVYNFQAMEQLLSDSMAQRRLNLSLLSFFSLIAALLAIVGIYGVIANLVSQRTREIGIRIALGARPADVLRMVLGQGLRLTLFGTLIGVCGALALTRFLSSLLFEVSTTDVPTFVFVSLVTATVTLLACWIPARRAAKTNPMTALRYE